MDRAKYTLDKIGILSGLTTAEDIEAFYTNLPMDTNQYHTPEQVENELKILQEESAYLRARYQASRVLGETVLSSTLIVLKLKSS